MKEQVIKTHEEDSAVRLKASWIRSLLFGIYFSLLSALRIGWRDFNIGTWIANLFPKEFRLAATGWVRTVSNLQAILGVYLFAWWLVTYFGRPFG